MFVPHALLLRGILYALWREDEKGLKDLQEVVNTQADNKEVRIHVQVSHREFMWEVGGMVVGWEFTCTSFIVIQILGNLSVVGRGDLVIFIMR